MTAVAIVLGLCFVAWRLEQVAIRVFDRQYALAERRVSIEERKYQQLSPESELPKEIEAIILNESEEWAQEDLRKMARGFYADLGNWQKVGQRLSGVLSLTPDERVLPS